MAPNVSKIMLTFTFMSIVYTFFLFSALSIDFWVYHSEVLKENLSFVKLSNHKKRTLENSNPQQLLPTLNLSSFQTPHKKPLLVNIVTYPLIKEHVQKKTRQKGSIKKRRWHFSWVTPYLFLPSPIHIKAANPSCWLTI